MSAADRLRASVHSLTSDLGHSWRMEEEEIRTDAGGLLGVTQYDADSAEGELAVTEHIALAASPDQVLALADLLDAVHAHHDATRVFNDGPQVTAYRAARDALARLEALIEAEVVS